MRRSQREDGRALRLAGVLMRLGTRAGDSSSLQVVLRLRRDTEGNPTYSVRMGAVTGTGPTLPAAILAALDLVGLN